MGKRSFLRGGFVRVKTVMGLEPFEVGKNSCRRPSEISHLKFENYSILRELLVLRLNKIYRFFSFSLWL